MFYSPASPLPTPYLIFSTGATIERVNPDGSDHQQLMTDLRGAASLAYNYGCAFNSCVRNATFIFPKG